MSLSLEEWREQIGYNPWHFWGLAGSKAPITSQCNSIVKQHSWQGADVAGRVDILTAIANAEEKIAPHLGYYPTPHYKEVTLQWPRYPQLTVSRFGYAGSDARWMPLQLPEGFVIASGVKTETLIGTAAVVYSDLDGDGLKESFEVNIATTETNVSNLCAYFAAADRYDGSSIEDRWKIAPVKITISGGNAKIKGNSWLLVKPVLYQSYSVSDLNADDSTNYVTTIDLWKVYTNPDGTSIDNAQATLIWETPPYPWWYGINVMPLATAGFDPAAVAMTIARVGIRNAQTGIVTVGESVYDPAENQWYAVPWYASANRWRPPDRVIIRYYAGVPLVNGKTPQGMADIVSKVATAELPRRICACEESNRNIYYWQFDLARSSGANDESYSYISREDLNNPLGTRRGQVHAWKQIKPRRVFYGFSAG